MNILRDNRGIALISVYTIVMILLFTGGVYTARSLYEFKFAMRQRDEIKAYYTAEAGLNQASIGIYQLFAPIAYDSWRDDTFAADLQTIVTGYAFPTNVVMPDGLTYSVMPTAANPVVAVNNGALLKLIAVGQAPHLGGTTRKVIAANVSFMMDPSPIFTYAYFVNNFGWLKGAGITINGDARSNGNFDFTGNPMINGDIYATTNPALGAAGTVTGLSRSWDTAAYTNHAPIRARSTNPTDAANPDATILASGYSGTSTRYENSEVLDMPYLGDLSKYKDMADDDNGQISQGAIVLVNEVYEYGVGADGIGGTADDVGVGPDGVGGTPDDGCMILIGTVANPLVIDGTVVVEKDIIIRGVVEGQGTIYTGRNIHIGGDIIYANEPSWPKPDPDPVATAAVNRTKDFLGLASKGNVLIGNYTRNDWFVTCKDYLKPPFTQGYVTDSTDAGNGYDSDGNPLNGYFFDGDYTVADGGDKDDGLGGAVARKYYEGSFSDTVADANIDPSNLIRIVNAVIYNNHAAVGKVGRFTLNGSLIARDEALIWSGNLDINYDLRASTDSLASFDSNLPRDLALPRTRTRQESI
ncbi:pilus assembly PilX N-terminal domain-containing protein [Candidatus Omnitrophota bacterium]